MKKKQLVVIIIVILSMFAAVVTVFAMRTIDRYSFTFYSGPEGKIKREYRRLPVSENTEKEVCLYIEEYLLGTATLESAPLFTRGTKLITAFLRGDNLYINLSMEAAMPPLDITLPNGSVDRVFDTLRSNIKKNFPKIVNIKLFIEGQEIVE